MKYTNTQNLPEPIVNAIINDPYQRGEGVDYSVTELIDPPRKRTLQKKHDHEIEEDVADHIFRLMGQAIHVVLERAGVPEKRFAITILGKTISGKIDRFKDTVIQDWKMTSSYRFKEGKAPAEIEAQLNCYAEILRQNGQKVTKLEAVPVFRDWSKLEMLRNKDYPRKQTMRIEVELWPREVCVAYLESRVRVHEAAKIELPECTPSETWARPEVWAVMKKGQKKAKRLLNTLELAEEFKSEQKDKNSLWIVKRPGERVRCQSYCSAAPFCSQFQTFLKNQEEPIQEIKTEKATTPTIKTFSGYPAKKELQVEALKKTNPTSINHQDFFTAANRRESLAKKMAAKCECGRFLIMGKWGKPYCRHCYFQRKEQK